MNANAHFTLHRDPRWLYRLAAICLLLGGGIVAGCYLGDGDDPFFSSEEVRYFVVPLCHVLLALAPLMAWAAHNNSLPALMLTDTALLYRPTLWSSRFRGVSRASIRSIAIKDIRTHGSVVGRTLLVHVDDLQRALLPGTRFSKAEMALNQRMLGAAIAISSSGWPKEPAEVKAIIDRWIAEAPPLDRLP